MTPKELAEALALGFCAGSGQTEDLVRVVLCDAPLTQTDRGTLYYLADGAEPSVPGEAVLVVPEVLSARYAANCRLLRPKEADSAALCERISRYFSDELEFSAVSVKLHDALIRGLELQQFLDLCAEAVGNSIVFSGNDRNLVARAGEAASGILWDEMGRYGRFSDSTINLESFRQLSLELERSTEAIIFDRRITNHSSAAAKVVLNGVQAGIVSILDTRRPLREIDKRFVTLIGELLVNYVSPDTFIVDSLAQRRTRLVLSLLSDDRSERIDYESAAETLQLDGCYRVLLLCRDEHSTVSTPLSSVIPFLLDRFPDGIVLRLIERICVIAHETPSSVFYRHESWESEYLSRYGLVMGVSRPGTGVSQFRTCYRQAQKAIFLGTRLGDTGKVYEYEKHLHDHLWQLLSASVDLKDYCHPAALTLLAYDRQNESDYAATLEALLDNNGNQAVTAAALDIHKSTLRYRLEKITSLTGLDLNDPKACATLHVSFRILRLLKSI